MGVAETVGAGGFEGATEVAEGPAVGGRDVGSPPRGLLPSFPGATAPCSTVDDDADHKGARLATYMRVLPDPESYMRDAAKFVFDSSLCRRALSGDTPEEFAVLVRDVIAGVQRLTLSCHLPEFTDHGLPHLCSLVDRICRWTPPPGSGAPPTVVDGLTNSECAVLLLATLLHDIGMLSQRIEDLEDPRDPRWARGYRDIANWVRRTHIPRIKGLVHRLFEKTHPAFFQPGSLLLRSIPVAMAHGAWPCKPEFSSLAGKDSGLAAIVAVTDLLDEDSNRCDTKTLVEHRHGSLLNMGHWIRHGLTADRVLVEKGVIHVKLARPPGTDSQMAPVYAALRNHYRLALLYSEALERVGAGPLPRVEFDPPTGTPVFEANRLADWRMTPGLATQSALVFHLLSSFLPEATLDNRRLAGKAISRLRACGFEPVDLTNFQATRGTHERRSPEELAFRALIGP